MSTLSVRLADSLHKKLRECAEQEGTSINQLINAAVGEKIAALLTEEYLAARGRRGSRRKFLAVLRSVPDTEPSPSDRLPAESRRKRGRASRRSG